MKKLFLLLLMVTFGLATSYAQTVVGEWYNDKRTGKVRIYKAKNGKYYGKLVWLKVPTINGKPKVDGKNPNRKLRKRPLMNMLLLTGFKKVSNTKYEDGKIYDPTSGKTYSCKMTLKGNKLHLRGYIGISLIGKTTVWTRA